MSREQKTVEVVQRRSVEVYVCDGCGKEAPTAVENAGGGTTFQQYPMDWFRIGHGSAVKDACSERCASNVLVIFTKTETMVGG